MNNQLKASLTEEEATLRLIGMAEIQKGLVVLPRWWLRFQRDSSPAKVMPKELESQPNVGLPNRAHQSEEETPTYHLAVKISRDSVCQGETGVC